MKYFCIADERPVLSGLRLAGIEGVLAETPREVEAAAEAACADPDVAVLLVTEHCHDLCREKLDEIKLSAHRPLLNVIPGSRGTGRQGDSMMQLINEAIGVKF